MIVLHNTCLVFQTLSGANVPSSAESVILELIGEGTLDPEVVKEAASAIVYYFRHEENREHVTVGEFALQLKTVLMRLGYEVGEGPQADSSEFELIVEDIRPIFCEDVSPTLKDIVEDYIYFQGDLSRN